MGGTYIRSVHSEVGLALKQALREGRVAMNPCELATPPNNDSQPRKAMNAEQLKAFEGQLDLADEHDFAYWLAVTPSLRRGEVCGLSWGDVDWGGRQLNVVHSYDTRRNLKSTKTAAGRRSLPLTDEALEALKAHRDAQARSNAGTGGRDPIIVTEAGTRVHPDMLEKWWRRDRSDLGAQDYCLHELWHSYLTALARGRAPQGHAGACGPRQLRHHHGHLHPHRHDHQARRRRGAQEVHGGRGV